MEGRSLSYNTTCGDGKCQQGESCLICPEDCMSGTSGGTECGNNVCEDGETCYNCPNDCHSNLLDDEVDDYYCCYGGSTNPGVTFALSCELGNYRCGTNYGKCSEQNATLVNYCCGDGVCQGEETIHSCKIDCDTDSPTSSP